MDDEKLALVKIIQQDNFDIFKKVVPSVYMYSHVISIKSSNFPDFLHGNPNLLMISAFFGSMQILNYLLENGADINKKDQLKRNASHFAVAGGKIVPIQLLHKYGADFSDTVLLAASVGDIVVLKFLIETLKVDACFRDSFESSLLHAAVTSGSVDMVDFVLRLNVIDINTRDIHGNTPFHIALQCGNIYIINLLLNHPSLDISPLNKKFKTVFHLAAEKKTTEILETILLHRINKRNLNWDFTTHNSSEVLKKIDGVNKPKERVFPTLNASDIDGFTPFLCAISSGGIDVVRFFMEHPETDIYAKNNRGQRCIHIACLFNRFDVLQLLLENPKFNFSSKDSNGYTPIAIAAKIGFEDIVKLLLENRPESAKIRDNDMNNLLHFASGRITSNIIPLIAFLGVNEVNKRGETPLHIASKMGNVSVIEQLISCPGINPNMRDNCGCTPLHILAKSGHVEACQLLINNQNTDVNAIDFDGYTPLHYSTKFNNINITNILIESQRVQLNIKSKFDESALDVATDQNMVKVFLCKKSI